jgi:hypothetical protein
VDNIFVIWPLGIEELQKFHQHVNNVCANKDHNGNRNKQIVTISEHFGGQKNQMADCKSETLVFSSTLTQLIA